MAKIIKSYGISFEDMFRKGFIIECAHDCQVGDIIDECFVNCGRSPADNTLKSGDMTFVIPLKFVAVVDTHADLSQYGFYNAYGDRWIRHK